MASTARGLLPNSAQCLTDQAWQKVSALGRLPCEARGDIDAAIKLLHVMRFVNYSPSRTKVELLKAEQACNDLIATLESVNSDPLTHVAIARTLPVPFEDAMRENAPATIIADALGMLRSLTVTFHASMPKIKKSKPGARQSAMTLAMFVQMLDDIKFQFTGKRLIRDSKGHATGRDFIKGVCDAAGVTATPDQIDGALRHVMEGRRLEEIASK